VRRGPGRLLRGLASILVRGEGARFVRGDLDETMTRDLEQGMPVWRARRRYLQNLLASSLILATAGVRLPAASLPRSLAQDVRHAFRSLRRDPALTLLAVIITGLGVAASSAVYSVADALLLRPLPFEQPERLVFISNGDWGRGQALSDITTQVARLQNIRAESRFLEDVAGFYLFDGEGDHTLTGTGTPERVTRLQVTGNFFRLLGVQPHLGRLFTPEEARDGGPAAALLPYGFWARRFAADSSVVGGTLLVDGKALTIIGVLPASFDYAAVFAPGSRIDYVTAFPLSERTNDQGNTLALAGRLLPGAGVADAHREVIAIAERNESGARNDFEPIVRPLREHVSGDFRFATVVLVGAVGLVMLIVCANLSNLLLARGAAREKELATRAALGAGRARLLRQMLTESMVLAGAGAALGLLLAVIATRQLARLDASIPLLSEVRVDGGVVAVTVLVAAATGIVSGLAPALRGSASTPGKALQESGRGSSGSRRLGRLRSALVVSEIALACVLLVGASLLIRSFVRVLDADLGFRPERSVAIRIDPTLEGRFASHEEELAYFEQILERTRGAPTVEAAGLVDVMPMAFNRRWCFGGDDCPYVRIVSEGYLAAMGLPLVRGRDLTAADRAESRRVVLVNETLAGSMWPGADPLGRTVESWQGDWEVVGVVRGMRHLAVDQAPGPEIFFPLRQQRDYAALHLIARGSGSVNDLMASVRQAVARVDPTLPLEEFSSIEDIVQRSVSARRFTVLLLGAFAGFALILASLGIYGVVSYSVTQRYREIGIRVALGASGGELQRRILADMLRLAALGMALGLLAAWVLGRAMASLLYEVAPTDPATFAAVPVILIGVSALAGWLPARRAARVDPVRTLAARA
jgi:predicted permease